MSNYTPYNPSEFLKEYTSPAAASNMYLKPDAIQRGKAMARKKGVQFLDKSGVPDDLEFIVSTLERRIEDDRLTTGEMDKIKKGKRKSDEAYLMRKYPEMFRDTEQGPIDYNYRNFVSSDFDVGELLEERRAACDKAIYKIKGGCKRRCNKILGNKQDCQDCLDDNVNISSTCKGPVSMDSRVYSDGDKKRFSNEDKKVQGGINRAISEDGDQQMKEAVDRLRGELLNDSLTLSGTISENTSPRGGLLSDRRGSGIQRGSRGNRIFGRKRHGNKGNRLDGSFLTSGQQREPQYAERPKMADIVDLNNGRTRNYYTYTPPTLGGGKKKKKNKRTKKRKRSKKKRTKKR
jgi:hypothetical protein